MKIQVDSLNLTPAVCLHACTDTQESDRDSVMTVLFQCLHMKKHRRTILHLDDLQPNSELHMSMEQEEKMVWHMCMIHHISKCVFVLGDFYSHDGKEWIGYIFVRDNIDKNVKLHFQRYGKKGQSLHFFHGYAVGDRLDLSHLSDTHPPPSTPTFTVLLPSRLDMTALKDEFKILVSISVYALVSICV